MKDAGVTERIFTSVDQLGEFKGGQAGLSNYVATNLRYFSMSIDINEEGKVLVN